jgi:putative DNA primase/helicase
MQSLPRAVAAAVEHGWSVVMVGLDKKPLVEWATYQTERPTLEQVRRWYAALRPAGWAVVTGEISGVVVIDFDGGAGLATMQKYGILPHLRTGSGGAHEYVLHPSFRVPTLNGKSKLILQQILPGTDVRGDGGIAVFYGRNGSGPYKRLRALSAPDPWAGELIEKLTELLRVESQLPAPDPGARIIHAACDARVSANEILQAYLAHERNGAGRNDTGFDLAVQLRDNGYDESEAAVVMFEYAATVKKVNTKGHSEPYSEAEVRATLRSVYGRPARAPWTQKGQAGAPGAVADAEQDGQQARAEDDWPQPEPLQEELPSVLAFDEELLPDSFLPLIADISERMQIPLDLPAAAMVVCLAGVVNRRATIQPKACDAGWIIPLNLWGGIVAPPGFLKSPTLRTITAPLYRIESFWREEYQSEVEEHEAEEEAAELRLAAWKEQVKATFKKGATPPLRPDTSLRPPTQKRLIVGDATFEKLHELMAENPAGLLVVRDELSGWMSQQDRPGREGERAFSLECWNGDVGHTIDRIARGSVYVPACCLSMLGGITPGRLRSYLTDALEDRPGNDGLLQRFQVLVWPDCPADWHYVDRLPDARSEQQAFRIFQKLAELDPESPSRLRFDRDAQQLFVEWLAELEGKIRGGEMHPALTAHLAKYRRLMPAIAALFELADDVAANRMSETVCLKQAQRAAAWCEYLESHARRVYASLVSPQLRAARELADKIRQRKIGETGSFSCREIYWKGWRGLDSPEAVKQAAEVLEDAGWVRRVVAESRPLGGRPADRFAINPRVYQ